MAASAHDDVFNDTEPRSIAPSKLPTFETDDVFSDGDDDHGLSFQFDSEAARSELARTQSEARWTGDDELGYHHEDLATRIGFSHDQGDPDASVSTLDINGPNSPRSPARSHARTHSSTSEDSSQSGAPPNAPRHNHALPSEEAPVIPADEFVDLSLSAESVEDETTHDADDYPSVIIDSTTHDVLEVTKDGLSPVQPMFPPRRSSLPPERYPNGEDPRRSSIVLASTAQPGASSNDHPPVHPSAPSAVVPPTPTTPRPNTRPAPRSKGPSALEKVVSRTRPPFLPPKPRAEDRKHQADWEEIMRLSRLAEEKRRKIREEKRMAREMAVEESRTVWEKEIVPDWKAAMKKPNLRKLWWNGIPTSLRDMMWERAVGNALALSKDSYRTCLARAKRAISAGTFPTTTLSLIAKDIATTVPSLHIFMADAGPLHQELTDMLCAWVVSRSDEGLGYVIGASKIAAMFLLHMSDKARVFIAMRNLLERHCLRSFYGGLSTKDDVEAYYRIFDTLLANGIPKIYFNFKQHQISPAAYLPNWIIPGFLDHIPFESCARIWDVMLLEGDEFLYRTAIAMLGVLEPRLYFPERKELMDVLSAENKAAIEVARRDGVPLDDGMYQIYGVHEDTLWERMDEMDEWWKESTWTRLIQRELPDV